MPLKFGNDTHELFLKKKIPAGCDIESDISKN